MHSTVADRLSVLMRLRKAITRPSKRKKTFGYLLKPSVSFKRSVLRLFMSKEIKALFAAVGTPAVRESFSTQHVFFILLR